MDFIIFTTIITIAIVSTFLIGNKKPIFRNSIKKYFFYIISLVTLVIVLLTFLYTFKKDISQRFVLTQVTLLFAGILHLIIYNKKGGALNEIFFLTNTTLYLSAFLFLFVTFHNKGYYNYFFLSSILFFLLPSFFYKLYSLALSIPPEPYKKWNYSQKNNDPILKTSIEDLINLHLIIQTEDDDNNNIHITTKTAKHINFGHFFFHCINNYNESQTLKIDFLSPKKKPYEWYFTTKNKHLLIRKFIDPELTIEQNNLKKNTMIICHRISIIN